MKNPITLDKSQTHALSEIMNALFTEKRKTFVIAGAAGTGKTVILSEIFARLDFMGYQIICLAPTGKAASVLTSKCIPANTIHSFLYNPEIDPLTGELLGFKKKNKAGDLPNFILVDEASMIPKYIYTDLVSLHIPIVFFGDSEQLLPIENIDAGWNIMHSKDIELTEIHRLAAENPIIRLSADIRKQGYIDKKQYVGLPEITFLEKKDITRKCIAEYKPDVILCGTNKKRISFNELSRVAKNHHESFPEKDDVIICLKNHMNKQTNNTIFNGERFVIVETTERDILVTDKNNKKYVAGKYQIAPDIILENSIPDFNVMLLDDYFFEIDNIKQDGIFNSGLNTSGLSPPYTYGYALTVHKSQGSEFTHVMYFDEDISRFCDQRRFRYTAITRATQKLTIAL